jgi:hypothetical protein
MKIAKAHGYQKILTIHLQKNSKENFGGDLPNPSPSYKITALYNLYINPPPLINFEKKSLRKFMVLSPFHIKIKMDNFFFLY